MKVMQAEDLSDDAVLGRYDVAQIEGRKCGSVLGSAVRRRRRDAVAQRVDGDPEETSCVDQVPRRAAVTEQRHKVGGTSVKPCGHQDGIIPRGVELAEGTVADAAVFNGLSALQRALAELGALQIAVGGTSGNRKKCQAGAKET